MEEKERRRKRRRGKDVETGRDRKEEEIKRKN